MIDQTKIAQSIRQVLEVRTTFGGRSARIDRLVHEFTLRQLDRIETMLMRAFAAGGQPVEQATHSAFVFVAQCVTHFSKSTASSC